MRTIVLLALVGTAFAQVDPVCLLPKEEGPCRAFEPRYYFNTTTDACELFFYGGCQGNGNNFLLFSQCHYTCKGHGSVSANLHASTQLTSQWETSSVCQLPKPKGDCRTITPYYYYDTEEAKCKPFHYIRCDYKGNNFQTEQLCKASCAPTSEYEAHCLAKADPGPCVDEETTMWAFNAKTKVCEPFTYGGCNGNSNKYPTLESCYAKCLNESRVATLEEAEPVWHLFTQMTSSSVCSLDKEVGPCRAFVPRYYYSQSSGTCEPFAYGGCDGNGNNFRSAAECFKACSPHNAVVPRA